MIHILTTGGTIGGVDLNQKCATTTNPSVNITDFFQLPNLSFEYRIDPVFDKDSRLITQQNRELLVEKIRSSIFDKILITHGTYSMEDTAYYLGGLQLNKTIVLVGSFIPGSEQHTDAPFNLGYGLASLQFLDKGVYIAMNGQVFHWNNVYKNLKENRFKTLRP